MPSTHIPSTSNNIVAESYWKLSRVALVLSIALHVAVAVAFYSLNNQTLVIFNLLPVVIYAACIVLANRRMRLLVSILTLLTLATHSMLMTRMVGLASGFQYYVWLVVPLILFNTESRMRTKVIVAGLSILACIAAFSLLLPLAPLIMIDYGTLSNFFIFNVACFLIANGVLAFTYAHAVGEASRQLHELATTDGLTGLANRRRMLEIATHEIARAKRAYQPISIMLLDIDHFKSINDRFGHSGGDNVLRAVTQILRKTIRAPDYIARWGGEEFLVLMPGVALEVARVAAERTRLTLATTPLSINEGAAECIGITCTVGVSEWQMVESIDQSIERADMALYRGKSNGRDRVEVHQHDQHENHDDQDSDKEPDDTMLLALLEQQRATTG